MTASVEELVRAAADGDERAWGALVDRFAPLLWSVCRRYELSAADTDDVAQVVWLRLLEHLPTLRSPAALPGWLLTTARRECIRLARVAQGRATAERPLLVEVVPDGHGPAADEALLRAERNDALRAAFAQLGERCRKLLGLLLRDPPTPYAQISEDLGIAIGSIGPHRVRCLAALRRTPEVAALLAADQRSSGGSRDADRVER
ncbi:RNA polymerase sigma factor [Cryptosporangium phraense]|uniref:Sigma-70 family RNA polymerase sigma factor n=1 Tax=Cryptosporangium phraense TaxID=2593070 RepID=A0A545AEU9_9ACTN|nr:sigma-70 family RNA polymerase sigma factor [Cryptosporangium phraense]TQS39839.1 sigma-70 family RNA polymerase sigma factor [Cryptosporangium phraense]